MVNIASCRSVFALQIKHASVRDSPGDRDIGNAQASNLLDRITYGKVIDFMNLGLGPVRTGIFNVADMAIMLGAAIVVVAGYCSDRRAQMRGSD